MEIRIKRRKRIGEGEFFVKIKRMEQHKSNENLIVLKVATVDDLRVEQEFCVVKDSDIQDKLIDAVTTEEDYSKEYTEEDFIGENVYISTVRNKKGFLNIIDISKDVPEEENDPWYRCEDLLDEVDFEEDDFKDMIEQEPEEDDLF